MESVGGCGSVGVAWRGEMSGAPGALSSIRAKTPNGQTLVLRGQVSGTSHGTVSNDLGHVCLRD